MSVVLPGSLTPAPRARGARRTGRRDQESAKPRTRRVLYASAASANVISDACTAMRDVQRRQKGQDGCRRMSINRRAIAVPSPISLRPSQRARARRRRSIAAGDRDDCALSIPRSLTHPPRNPRQTAASDPKLGEVWTRIIGTSAAGHYGRPFAFHSRAQRADWARPGRACAHQWRCSGNTTGSSRAMRRL